MATKSRKNTSKKKATKKAGKRAQIQLDPETVLQFESHLRQGLIASGAVLMAAGTPRLQPGAKVELDSDTTAQIASLLRDGLVSSAAVLAAEYPQGAQPAAKARKSGAKSTRKKSGRTAAKKR